MWARCTCTAAQLVALAAQACSLLCGRAAASHWLWAALFDASHPPAAFLHATSPPAPGSTGLPKVAASHLRPTGHAEGPKDKGPRWGPLLPARGGPGTGRAAGLASGEHA
jgi:hypothetical protein